MINLLPTQEKREILAGRTNRLLVRYIVLLAGVVGLMLIAFAFVWFYLDNIRSTNQAKIDQNDTASRQLATEQQAIDAFRSDLQTAKTILDKQVNYSDIVLRIARTIPKGVVIDQLSLDPTTFGTPTTLTARAKSEAAVLALKAALANSPYYSNARFDTIALPGDSSNPYAYRVTMFVTLTQELLNDN